MASDPKRVEELAKRAKEALDGPEESELRAAEERAKKVGKGVSASHAKAAAPR